MAGDQRAIKSTTGRYCVLISLEHCCLNTEELVWGREPAASVKSFSLMHGARKKYMLDVTLKTLENWTGDSVQICRSTDCSPAPPPCATSAAARASAVAPSRSPPAGATAHS